MAIIEWTEQGTKTKAQAARSAKKAKKTAKVSKVNDDVEKQQLVVNPEIKKQPKMKEVVRKLVTRQKKGQQFDKLTINKIWIKQVSQQQQK